jgi:RHS repeat-associated protein
MSARTCLALTVLFGALISLDAVAAPFGRTAGNFTVPSDGSANYSIPIWTPPGVAGLQPSLALNYNSRNGDGLLGVGWQLTGLSAISRCNLTIAQDGVAGSPQLTSGDRFCLDGNRLRTTNGSTYGAAGATYQTEIANFSNVTSNGTAGSGPAWFKVQGKDGLTYEYGNTADSAILAQGSTSVRTWALNAVRDRNGNAMTFTYTNDATNGSYRPASIQYTYTGSSTSNNGYSVVFTYQSRPGTNGLPGSDGLWKYKIGGVNNQLNYLSLVTVNTVSGSTVTMVHGYVLTYVTAPVSSRLRITAIQECASSTTDCFAASSVTYQDGVAGWDAEIADSGNATNLAFALPIDVNGDGIDDLVYPDPTSGHWYYELGSVSGTYAGPYDTGIASTNFQSALAIDFDSNGRKDVLVPNASGYWRVLRFVSAGAAFTYVDTTTSAAGVVPGSAMVGDIDGDGREDLIYAVSGGTGYAQPDYIYYRLNTGSAFSTTQGTLVAFPNGHSCSPCTKLGNSQPFGNPASRYNSQLRTLDFNGDGRTDFMVYLGSCSPDTGPGQCGTTSPIYYSWTIFLSQPNGGYVGAGVVTYPSGATPNQPPLIGDFNGDGCSDIAFTSANYWQLQFGTCGRSGTTTVLDAPVNTGLGATSTLALAMDWDGDGRTDLIQPTTGTSPHWEVARSLGNHLSAFVDTGIAQGGGSIALVGDFNGDGLEDVVYTSSTALKSRMHSGPGQPPDLLTAVTDAYGNSVSPTYVSIARGNYQSTSDATYPYRDYIGPLYVVNQARYSDPSNMPTGTYTQTFYYYGAWINLQGRGFQTINSHSIVDSRTALFEHAYFERAFPYTGMKYEDVWSNGSIYPDITEAVPAMITLDGTTNNQRYFPYFSGVTHNQVEVGGSENGDLVTQTVTSYTYNNDGNPTTVATAITDKDPGSPYLNQEWTTSTTTTYTPDHGTNWCLNMPTEVDVTNTAPGVSSITRHVSYTPDYSYCRETQKVVEPSSTAYKVTTGMGYDSFGNLNSRTVTGVGMAARITGINWGTSGQFPTTLTNALGQQTLQSFDPSNGKQLSQTDPNGIVTSWQYDTFARKIKELRPDGTSTTWAYNSCATAGCVNANNKMTVVLTNFNVTSGSILNTSNTYLDAVDRVLVTSKQLVTGAFDRTEVQYDSLGHVHQSSVPCLFASCTTYWTVNTYDVLDRLTQTQRPISASNSTLQTTTVSYAGRTTTTTDPQGKTTTTITKVTGSVGRTKDHNGYYVSFNHDAFGSVLSVTDSLSNTLKSATYLYGTQAFPQTSTDMDLGAWSYTFDALGELTAYSDAKSQSFSIIYDALSRPTNRTEPDLTTTWTWGATAANHNIGKLASVSSVSSAGTASHGYTFDGYGRLWTETITLPTVGAMTFGYGYDSNSGLLYLLEYPSLPGLSYRLQAEMSYQYGILHHIFDFANPATLWWRVDGVNPAGQATHESMQYGTSDPLVVQYHTYDAVTGWVIAIQGGANGGTGLQNQSYLYDEMGNVTQRQDNNAGLTENFYYDNLYRLDHSTLGGTTNLQMQYDGMGNITSRSDIAAGAAWTYDPTHKHQVTQAGSTAYSYLYDGNGNVRNRNGTLIGWTSYNYPSSVGTSTESATFDYGADRQRWRMIYTGPSGTETTYYATPRFEVVATSTGTDYRHYIYANGKPVVVVSHTSAGAVNASSLFTDHQGSISSIIASATATTVASESFTAYGNRREASTWSGSPTSSELGLMNGVSREGYTFQTVLGNMGLNHMNGRVQDAVTGRFLSADPQVSNPGNTQAYNLYSYVMNNPLSNTDPTGFLPKKLPYWGDLIGGRRGMRTEALQAGDSGRSIAHTGFGEGTIGNSVAGFNMDFPTDLSEYDGTGLVTGFSTGPFAGKGSYSAWVAAGEPTSSGTKSGKGGSAQSGGLNATFTRDASNPIAGGDYTNDTPAYIAALRADPASGLAYAESIMQYVSSITGNEEALAFYANEDGTYSYTFYNGDSPAHTPIDDLTGGDSLVILEHVHPMQICQVCFFGGAARGPSIGDSITANQHPNAYMAIWEYNIDGSHDYIYYGPTVGLPWSPPPGH